METEMFISLCPIPECDGIGRRKDIVAIFSSQHFKARKSAINHIRRVHGSILSSIEPVMIKVV